ncbi:hypothetical protein ScPMuIL_008559 [Solemya velum]
MTENKVTQGPWKEIRATFDLFDRDQDGQVSTSEIATIMRALGMASSEVTLTEMLNKMDKDGNGIVDYEEFESFVTENNLMVAPTDELDKELMDAFKVFDRDGDGFIDKDELRYVMTTLGEVMTDEEADALMREADANGDGRIDYKEFCTHICGKIPGL